jgi:pyruvate dehydrogenase E2 component (dihydrolipoamide acetyltransferase)
MLQSKREIPCFYLTVKADVTDLVEFRTKLNQTGGVKIAYNDFIVRAVAIGMEKFPIMTGQLDGETIRLAGSIGVGLAISVPDGLVAPIIKDVNKKDVAQIANDSKALVEKARNNKLSPADLEGGCITVSNLGAFGIESFIPIVVPGQCSILGIGQITDTCVPDNGNIMVRKLMNMTLSVDHKVANGAYAAQFLDYVRKLMEDTSTFA